jgi:hypothetical protein
MRCCDVYYVYVRVFDELVIGAVGFCCAGTLDIFDEVFGAGLGRGRCCCCEDVLDIVYIARSRVRK